MGASESSFFEAAAYRAQLDAEAQVTQTPKAKKEPEKVKKGHVNVVVFGGTGAGKSSLINLMMGEKVATVSGSAQGVTDRFTCFTHDIFNVYDTAGLNEGSSSAQKAKQAHTKGPKSTVTSFQAAQQLKTLMKNLCEEGGAHLFVYVTKNTRILETDQCNLTMFVEAMGQKMVPCVTVFTHCESDDVIVEAADLKDGLKAYAKGHIAEFRENFPMVKAGVAVFGADGHPDFEDDDIRDFKEGSREQLWDAFKAQYLKDGGYCITDIGRAQAVYDAVAHDVGGGEKVLKQRGKLPNNREKLKDMVRACLLEMRQKCAFSDQDMEEFLNDL